MFFWQNITSIIIRAKIIAAITTPGPDHRIRNINHTAGIHPPLRRRNRLAETAGTAPRVAADRDPETVSPLLVEIHRQPPVPALLPKDGFVVHFSILPKITDFRGREIAVPEHGVDMIAVISVQTLDAVYIVKRIAFSPSLDSPGKGPKGLSNARKVSREIGIVKRQRVVGALKPVQCQTQFQPVGLRPTNCGMGRINDLPDDLLFVLPVVRRV